MLMTSDAEVGRGQKMRGRSSRSSIPLVFDQDALCGPIQILVLARLQRPNENSERAGAEEQSERDEQQKAGHKPDPDATASKSPVGVASLRAVVIFLGRSRAAFATTRIDEEDMASAASSGVTQPAIAIGSAIAL